MRDAPPQPEHRPAAGLAFSGASYVLITIGDALSKIAVAALPAGQVLTVRCAFSLVLLSFAFFWTWSQGRSVFATRRLPLHALRSAIMIVSTVTFFVALKHIDLAKITAIMFLMPIFVAVFSGPLAGEPVSARQWGAIGLGFAGTLVILEPGWGGISLAEGLALLSAMTWAINLLMLRRLAASDPPLTVLAWFHVFVLPGYFVLGLLDWRPLDGRTILLIASMAGIHLVALWLGAMSFKLARAATVAPVQYSQLLWAGLFGWAIWGNVPGWPLVAGSVLIVAAGLLLLFAEPRRAGA